MFADALGADADGVPALGGAGGATLAGAGGASDPDGRVGFLDGLGLHLEAFQVVVLAVEDGFLFGAEELEDLDVFVGDGAAVGEIATSQFELLAEPADAGADDEAALGEDVEGGEHLGIDDGVAVGEDLDGDAKADALGDAGEEGEEGEGFEDVVLGAEGWDARGVVGVAGLELGGHDDVVADHEGVVTGLLDGAGEGGNLDGVDGCAEVGDHGSVLH